jgi:DNA invertase Pin-like site-specific DNA recombinase
MATAYSYRRFSSAKQKKGDSIRRQDEARDRYLAEHPELTLDDSLKADAGVSAFKGRNTRKGTLADFLALVRSGTVKPGSVLLVESLDRLSRQQLNKAVRLFMDIVEAGVKIVTFTPFREYDETSLKDLIGFLEPLVVFQRAGEESLVKAARGRAAWKARREGQQNGKKLLRKRGQLPAWIKVNDAGTDFEIDQPMAETVKLIYRLAAEGHGHVAISKMLNKKCVKPIGRKPKWNYTYVGLILRNRAVVGEYQPHEMVEDVESDQTSRRPVGEPIPNYFPRIITDKLFDKVQAAVKGRAAPRGRKGENIANLFTGLLVDARDGAGFRVRSKHESYRDWAFGWTVGMVADRSRRVRYLLNGRAVNGERATDKLPNPCKLTFPYDTLEAAILVYVKELNLDDLVMEQGTGAIDLARLVDRQAEIGATITETKNRLASGEKGLKSNVLLDLLVQLEDEHARVQDAIDVARNTATGQNAAALKDAKDLIDRLEAAQAKATQGDAAELAELRERVKGRIRALVDRIYVLLWVPKKEKGRYRMARLQIHLRGGHIRHIVIREDGRPAGQGLCDKIPANLDLRNFRESGMAADFPASVKAVRDARNKEDATPAPEEKPARGRRVTR